MCSNLGLSFRETLPLTQTASIHSSSNSPHFPPPTWAGGRSNLPTGHMEGQTSYAHNLLILYISCMYIYIYIYICTYYICTSIYRYRRYILTTSLEWSRDEPPDEASLDVAKFELFRKSSKNIRHPQTCGLVIRDCEEKYIFRTNVTVLSRTGQSVHTLLDFFTHDHIRNCSVLALYAHHIVLFSVVFLLFWQALENRASCVSALYVDLPKI